MRPHFVFQAGISPRLSSELDLSRWLAAALVLVYHVRENIVVPMPGSAGLAERAIYLVTSCGTQAVIWFFVLSGYLVGGGVVADIRRDRFSWARYALNRLSRLYVVLIPALLVGFALDETRVALHGGLMTAGDVEIACSYKLLTFLANVLCLETILTPTLGSNNPLWSLACEAWYYALFPLFAAPFMLRQSWTARVLPCLSGLAVLAFLDARNPQLAHLFAIWLLGVAIRFCPAPLLRSPALAWALAVAGMLAYPGASPHLGAAAKLIVALPFANLLLTLQHLRRDTDAARALPGARLHAMLAGFSYSLYLVHAPAMHFVLTLVTGRRDPGLNLSPSGLAPWLWGGALCLGLTLYAWGFGRLTEANTDRLRRWAAGLVLRRAPVR